MQLPSGTEFTSSPRVLSDFFWIGRYAERAEGLARLLIVARERYYEYGNRQETASSECVPVLLSALRRMSEDRDPKVPPAEDAPTVAEAPHLLWSLTADRLRPGSLAHSVERLGFAARSVRDQMSNDTWMVLAAVERTLSMSTPAPEEAEADGVHRLPEDTALADAHQQTLSGMLALSGLTAESLIHDAGWTMMDIGKRIERGLALVALLDATLTVVRGPDAERVITESALMACESSVVYRRLTLGRVSVGAVADLVLFDAENPRSLVYQLDRLRANLRSLSATASSRTVRLVDQISTRLRRARPGRTGRVRRRGPPSRACRPPQRSAKRPARIVRRHYPHPVVAARRHAADLGNRSAAGAAVSSRCYQITHSTEYTYSAVVTSSYGRSHLTPETPRQRRLAFDLHITPRPADRSTSRDAYGNISSYFHVAERHRALTVVSTSIVEVDPPPRAWYGQVRRWRRGSQPGLQGSVECLQPSSRWTCVHLKSPTRCGTMPHRVSFQCTLDRGHPRSEHPHLHRLHLPLRIDYRLHAGRRGAGRPEGVCQDFSTGHSLPSPNGLAASYVSGYLATDPPPGKDRMIGADATHAWAAVWTPENHWLSLDPTNDQLLDERYIVLGWGRDYADLPPLRGIIYTDSESSTIEVSVDVAPFDRSMVRA